MKKTFVLKLVVVIIALASLGFILNTPVAARCILCDPPGGCDGCSTGNSCSSSPWRPS